MDKGFNYVDACKFIKRTHETTNKQGVLWLTMRQLLKEECGDKSAVRTRIVRAKAQSRHTSIVGHTHTNHANALG